MRQSMTYGVLPNREVFSEAFSEECPGGKFKIRNCPMIGNDDLTESELWNQVESAVDTWNSESSDSEEWGDWASCVLSVLGFEWI